MSNAYGFVESQSYVKIIAAADIMVKTANISILGFEKTGGGYTTVIINGDVASVKSALDAVYQILDIETKLIPNLNPKVLTILQNLVLN